MKIENIDAYTLLNWYKRLVECSHYCPCVCNCREGIPDEFNLDNLETEILDRLV